VIRHALGGHTLLNVRGLYFFPGPIRARRLVVSVCVFQALVHTVAAHSAPLTRDDFRQIGPQGFGDRANSYAWSTAFFKGALYIGTNRNFACVVRSISGAGTSGRDERVPIECGENLLNTDIGGRIYSYDPVTGGIELVYISPQVRVLTSDGSFALTARDAGYRTMTVFIEPDGTESLYVGTFTSGEGQGSSPRLLRSVDGRHFEAIPGPVINNTLYRSYRSLTVFKNRLYLLALGRGQFGTGSALLEASDPASGAFRVVNSPSFGDPVNLAGFELEEFHGYLYVGTGTVSDGFQLLKTQANGEPPYAFQKVLVKGAYRGSSNQNVVSMTVFQNHLYIGTGINFAGLDLFPGVTVAPPELVRVRADDTWDLVSGDERDTPDGFKTPISGRRAGLSNPSNGYIWRMVEHKGVLYVGSFDNAVIAQYASDVDLEGLRDRRGSDLPEELIELLLRADPDELGDMVAAVEGGFDLWSSTDGVHFKLITWNGFGEEFDYGVRNFVSVPFGLYLGTANPFFGFRLYLGQEPGTDTDGDGYPDAEDNCPLTWNLAQADRDGDGTGDACDLDNDDDCIPDEADSAPFTPQTDPADTDGDGLSDRCDDDDDGDAVLDTQDNCPLVANVDQADSDADGVGDACDSAAADGDPGSPEAVPDNAEEDPAADLPLPALPQPCGAGMGAVLFGGVLGMVGLRSGRRRFRYGDA